MIKIAVFDLDGTLVNSLTDLALNVNKGLQSAGLPEQPIEKYKQFVGDGREMMIKRAMGDMGTDAALLEQITAVFNREYKVHCNDNTAAYDGCAGMLKTLADKGILTAVLSNKPDEFVDRILKKVYPDHSFAEAWGKKPEYRCKPDGEALCAILSKHEIAPEQCVYIGDSDVDVYTAQNAGVKMIGVSWGFRGKNELLEAGAPVVADTAEQLLEYILGDE